MTKAQYEVFEALNPFFGVVLKGLFRHVCRRRALRISLSISRLASNDTRTRQSDGKFDRIRQDDQASLRRRTCCAPLRDSRVVILEYEVHGTILSSGASYDNRLISVIMIENRKIIHWRDYMDSLAAWTALNSR